MADTKPDFAVMAGLKKCPNEDAHDPSPPSAMDWLTHTREKMLTHRPVRCPGCNLFKIWEPRPSEW